MSGAVASSEDSTDALFEEAPCGWLFTDASGTLTRANQTFRQWTGFSESELLNGKRFQDLLAVGGRILYQTHLEPQLRLHGSVSQIALEIARADGSWMPALINSVLRNDGTGGVAVISTMVFNATDRRRYESHLLQAQQREHDIAHELQRGMLTEALPQGPEFDIDVVYRPAVAGLEVGGDWYDAFWLDDRRQKIGLVVGDVVGRGLKAAAAMGQLRSAVRALAVTGLAPGALLDALDRYVRRHQVGQGSTVAYCELDLTASRLTIACAGHPPPLIISAHGDPGFDWGGRTAPLDVSPSGAAPRTEVRRELPAGSTVMLYTDGLIERRTHPTEDGLARLRDGILQLGPAVAGVALGQAIVDALHDRDHDDDVCVLTMEVRLPR